MRFLSVADRELRAAARQKATYRARWITAALFFALLVWLLYVFMGFTNPGVAPRIFKIFSVLSFLYCVFLAAARTADCISVERREGTLGLLFLTNLNSAEIIAGKLCSSALASVYGLLAIFPMLALPLLMGGITFGYFERTVVALLNGIVFALAMGLLASVLSKRPFTSIGLALLLVLGLGGGLAVGAEVANSYARTRPLAPWLAAFSPLYTLLAADGGRLVGGRHFWLSVAAVTGLSLGCLGLTTLLLARTWRDRPKSVRAWYWPRPWRRTERRPSVHRAALRRRLLAINPVFWLAGRQTVSSPVFMGLAVVLTLLTVFGTAPYFGRVMRAGTFSPVVGHFFAWLWTGLALHALVLYYAATTASQRLAEDKQTGALELLLSTPTTERTISRGLWLAYGRKMLFPALLVVLVHCFFIWMMLVLMILDPPGGQIPLGVTPGELFWSILLDHPVQGQALNWQFGFILRIPLLLLLLLMAAWPTLGWVGRWLGVRTKHPGFAPMASLVLLIVPPILLFSLACYFADKLDLTRLPENRLLPFMMWVAFAIGLVHCVLLSLWAGTCLHDHLRAVAFSRYQPPPRWRLRLPSRRTVRRLALATAVLTIGVPLLVVSYYGYQNWRSRRAWSAFQSARQQRREFLTVAPLLPAPVSAEANFACAPVFASLLSNTNRETKRLAERLRGLEPSGSSLPPNCLLMEWCQQTNAALRPFVHQRQQPTKGAAAMKRADDAAALLQDWAAHSARLQELAAAAARCSAFQTSTNRDVQAVFHPVEGPVLMLERLHLLFQVRACAALELGRNAEAAEDVLSGLRLAQLARPLPDVRGPQRVQQLLARSLQPLWEGLSQHAWTEPQLAAFEHELAGFNLLTDFTNAVRRVVLAHIEVWRAIPDHPEARIAVPAAYGGYLQEPIWRLQPRAWWFQNCIQLYTAGQNAIELVDVGSGRVQDPRNWHEVNGLPLDSASQELIQPPLWQGASPSSVAFMQTSVNQALIACALERFRLAKRAYPKTLDPLVPSLLARVPHDAASGRPIIYQSLGETNFLLRGVGPNGTDDRKSPASDDWLWFYSTNAPSAKQ